MVLRRLDLYGPAGALREGKASIATAEPSARQLELEAQIKALVEKVRTVQERRIAALETALREIQDLADGMPNCADHEADPENESPEDAGYHVAGLIWRCAGDALRGSN